MSLEEAQCVIDLAKSKAIGSCVGSSITYRTALEIFEVSKEGSDNEIGN